MGGGDEVLKRFMISDEADERGAGVEMGCEGAESPDPKISARRSCVDGPAAGPLLDTDEADMSSPIKSTTVSLSVRVDPTGFLSLTGECQKESNPIGVTHRFPSLSL